MRSVALRVVSAVFGGILLAFAFPLTIAPLHLPAPYGPLNVPLPFYSASEGYAQAWWIAFIALIPLMEAARNAARPREAFLLGYIGGLAWLLLHWMWLSSFGIVPVILLSAFFALPTGLFTFLFYLLLRSEAGLASPALVVWGTAALWTAIEYIRSFGLWAFPWNLLGYSQADNLPLLQVADFGGVYAVSFLIALANAALFALLTTTWSLRLRLAHGLLSLALICGALSYGYWRLEQIKHLAASRQIRVGLVQGGLETLERWSQDTLMDSLTYYLPPTEKLLTDWKQEVRDLRDAKSEVMGPQLPVEMLVLWPETSLPVSRGVDPRHPENMPAQVQSLVRRQPATMLIGAMGRPNSDRRAENGCLVFNGDGVMDWAYSKVRLVPYGEVVPFRNAVEILPFPWGSLRCNRCRHVRSRPYNWQGVEAGLRRSASTTSSPYVSREEAARAARTCFVLVTNNSWYKLNNGVRQHCDIDILRAIESRRPLARVSTTGWSHIVGADGRIIETTGVDGPGTISRWVALSSIASPYTLLGDLFAQLCLYVSVMLCIFAVAGRRSEGYL